jgi:hypothetical protein
LNTERPDNFDVQESEIHNSQLCVNGSKVVPLIAAVGVAVLTAHVIDASKTHVKPVIDQHIETYVKPHFEKLHKETKACSIM